MEELLKELYRHSLELDVNHVDWRALCGLSSGYLSVYRLGLLFPWTVEGLTDLVPVHGRVKRIAWRLELLSRDEDIPVPERVDYVAGLLGSYVMGTDTELVARGLETAWELLHERGGERLSLPCRTSGMCRLLCQCHYFTGDGECLELAGGLATEAMGRSGTLAGEELLEWRDALRLYVDVSDGGGDGETGTSLIGSPVGLGMHNFLRTTAVTEVLIPNYEILLGVFTSNPEPYILKGATLENHNYNY